MFWREKLRLASSLTFSPQSFTLVENLMRLTIANVAFLRNLLPSNCFQSATLSGVRVQRLVPGNREASVLSEWLENGVFDALRKRYLRSVVFGVYLDPDQESTLIESYTLHVAYGADGAHLEVMRSSDASTVSTEPLGSREEIQASTVQLIRTLIALTGTLRPVPSTRWLTMKLFYYDDVTPPEYEPLGFRKAEDSDTIVYFDEPMKLTVGTVATKHVSMSLRMKTAVDSFYALEEGKAVEKSSAKAAEMSSAKADEKSGTAEKSPPMKSAEKSEPEAQPMDVEEDEEETQVPEEAAARPAAPSSASRRNEVFVLEDEDESEDEETQRPDEGPPAEPSPASSTAQAGAIAEQMTSLELGGEASKTSEKSDEERSFEAMCRDVATLLRARQMRPAMVAVCRSFPSVSAKGARAILEQLVTDGVLERRGKQFALPKEEKPKAEAAAEPEPKSAEKRAQASESLQVAVAETEDTQMAQDAADVFRRAVNWARSQLYVSVPLLSKFLNDRPGSAVSTAIVNRMVIEGLLADAVTSGKGRRVLMPPRTPKLTSHPAATQEVPMSDSQCMPTFGDSESEKENALPASPMSSTKRPLKTPPRAEPEPESQSQLAELGPRKPGKRRKVSVVRDPLAQRERS